MYSSRNSILLLGITIFILLLWCTVQPTYADTNEEEHHVIDNTEEDNNSDDEINDFDDLYRRASLRPYGLQQRASLRPFAGKRASLRPFAGKRASLRPFAGKRASLRPANYVGKRKRRNVLFYDE
ncbi:unnamed protein product [Rotaria sp. Silwood1]|nr:unnamed protein product [Rotaria sp. Silwood1]CAF0736844.1 unnamed protein product [Rotaria sp. Silwood1]CAF0791405.1 unnamed protein product [Rotaria sp. Silwood1]CAF3326770.1 unnamed protein product [Rotaria sp. Silwood1]CAF3334229.1 unnamed protein product [Rotaria sp. Silwood1]